MVPETSLFIHRYFTAENRLAEIICAIVMVLSFTATTGGSFEGTTPNALLIAVLGCNIAWGIVDGATYILGNLLNRGVRARLLATLKQDPANPEAGRIVAKRIEAALGPVLTPEQLEQVRVWVGQGVARHEPEPNRVTREDLLTGLACFIVVFSATLPLLLPFLLIKNDQIALRICNALMLVMLFLVGWRWAGLVNINRMKMGLTLLGTGLVLVIVTVLLGG